MFTKAGRYSHGTPVSRPHLAVVGHNTSVLSTTAAKCQRRSLGPVVGATTVSCSGFDSTTAPNFNQVVIAASDLSDITAVSSSRFGRVP